MSLLLYYIELVRVLLIAAMIAVVAVAVVVGIAARYSHVFENIAIGFLQMVPRAVP